MKMLACLLLMFTVMTGACIDKKTCTISGTLTNGKDTTVLYLYSDSLPEVDSIFVVNGQLRHQLPLAHPMRFVLHNKRNQYDFRDRKVIWLEPSEINITGDLEFMKKMKVTGSASQMVYEDYSHLIDSVQRKMTAAKDELQFTPEDKKDAAELAIGSLRKELSQGIVDFMTKHKDSYVVLSALHDESYLAFRVLDKEQIKQVYSQLPQELKAMPMGHEIKRYYELPEPPKVGDMAPEIIQVSPKGDTIRLSDFRGKYVLLDFWSSSCAPCRGEFKWLKKAYSKYHPKGLEILGVSGDSRKQAWVNAIANDSIPWVNVSDLKGWQNEAFLRYDIKMMPYKFLVNPDGMIVKDRIWFSSESITEKVLGEIFKDKKMEGL